MTVNFYAIAILSCFSLTQVALAKATQGPKLTIENRSSTPLTDSQTEKKLGVEEKTTNAQLNLLVPIPAPFLGGMLISKIDLVNESKEFTGDNADIYNTDELKNMRERDMAAVGFVYLPHAKEGAPKFFALAARYSKLDVTDSAQPMGEYILGMNMDGKDTPFNIKFDPTQNAGISLIARHRRFPAVI